MSIKTTELLCTSHSWDGALLPDYPSRAGHVPSEKVQIRASRMEFPVGDKTGWHHHTVINFGIVEQGELTIVCLDGTERVFREGEILVEVVGTIHRGENRGHKPVILNMFYLATPDIEVTIQHPEIH
ncbi:MAG: cupin domain-containing protein [Paludibacteraceae bacterium]|nr:cupin domain-containing protein [Paludibacteraceae bacterium]